MEVVWMIVIVLVCGAVGGLLNAFIGDNGFHLPIVENGVFQPGVLGTILIGAVAALTSWCAAKAIVLIGGTPTVPPTVPVFSTGDIANALIVGFGGAKWFQSQVDKANLSKAVAIAAGKAANAVAAAAIAGASPRKALDIVTKMP
jgi:hypothetical protein